MWLIGIIILIVGVLVSVALHELGHLLPAKKFGTAVPEYWIGFGPKIWSTQRNGTTYGIKAILLGGYVKILGMFPPPRPGQKTMRRSGRLTLAEEARLASEEEIAKARQEGVTGVPFYKLSTGKKLVVMTGGPLMNLLISVVLVAVILLGFGWQSPTTTIGSVVDKDGSPAVTAGIEAGDQIVSWGGTPVDSWDELRKLIQQTPESGTPVELKKGNGQTEQVTVIPQVNDKGERYVGIVSQLHRERGNLGDVGAVVWTQFTGTVKAVVGLPVGLFNLTKSMFTGGERDPNGVVSILGVARIAGEITSPDSMTQEQQTATGAVTVSPSFEDRVVMLLSLLASLNMALFVFNLIPLPPLDGGHVAGALYGGVRNLAARFRGKPKPAPADTARLMPLTYGVFGALILMTVVLMIADVVNPVTIG